MSMQLTPSKRPDETEANGRGKWQKTGNFSSPKSSAKGNILRILCPDSKIGGVIGNGGSIISQIRQETGVKIQVEEPVPGCDDRVVTIISPDKDDGDGRVIEETKKEHNDENEETEPRKNAEEDNENNEDKQEGSPVDEVPAEEEKDAISSLQKALFLVFERMVDAESEKNGGLDEEGDKDSTFVVRLLVFSGQIGCLLGKAGSVIKQMASESGAQIWILPRDKLPPSASPSDELVQVVL